jgi:hypothetical protein
MIRAHGGRIAALAREHDTCITFVCESLALRAAT